MVFDLPEACDVALRPPDALWCVAAYRCADRSRPAASPHGTGPASGNRDGRWSAGKRAWRNEAGVKNVPPNGKLDIARDLDPLSAPIRRKRQTDRLRDAAGFAAIASIEAFMVFALIMAGRAGARKRPVRQYIFGEQSTWRGRADNWRFMREAKAQKGDGAENAHRFRPIRPPCHHAQQSLPPMISSPGAPIAMRHLDTHSRDGLPCRHRRANQPRSRDAGAMSVNRSQLEAAGGQVRVSAGAACPPASVRRMAQRRAAGRPYVASFARIAASRASTSSTASVVKPTLR